ncbi:MAG: N-acetyltransferase family protein [Chloroflexi bacterium]|nr:MAG: N-acetyltransferase family protein [Chloroflexota bacterium]
MVVIRVRLAEPRDAAELQAIYAPMVGSSAISFEVEPPTAEEMARRIARTMPTHPWLVVEDQGQLTGYAYAGPFRSRPAYRWSVEVSAYIHSDWRRRGVGRSLYTALLTVLAIQGYREACAGITLPNPASVGLHQALGFVPVGVYRRVGWKLGAWHDVGWWQRSLTASTNGPGEPQPLDRLDRDQFRAALNS